MGKLTQDQYTKIEQVIAEVSLLYENGEEDKLTEFEQGFMASMEERFTKYGDDTFVSPKQMTIIDNIYDKLVGE